MVSVHSNRKKSIQLIKDWHPCCWAAAREIHMAWIDVFQWNTLLTCLIYTAEKQTVLNINGKDKETLLISVTFVKMESWSWIWPDLCDGIGVDNLPRSLPSQFKRDIVLVLSSNVWKRGSPTFISSHTRTQSLPQSASHTASTWLWVCRGARRGGEGRGREWQRAWMKVSLCVCGWTCECLCELAFCVPSACSVAHRAETYLYTRTPTLQKRSPVTFCFYFHSSPPHLHPVLTSSSHVSSFITSPFRLSSPPSALTGITLPGGMLPSPRQNACSRVTFECRAELNKADRSGSLLPKRCDSLLAVAQSLTPFLKSL